MNCGGYKYGSKWASSTKANLVQVGVEQRDRQTPKIQWSHSCQPKGGNLPVLKLIKFHSLLERFATESLHTVPEMFTVMTSLWD